MRSRSESGFTLLELIVALAVVALVLAVTVPRLDIGAGGLRADEHALLSALRLAREQAILTETETAFTIDLETLRWSVPAAGAQGVLSGRASLVVMADIGEKGPRTAAVRFLPDGASSGGEFLLQAGEGRRTVRVDWLTGRVTADAAP